MADTRTTACPVCSTDTAITKTGRLFKHKAAKTDKLPCPGSGQPVGTARIPRPHHGWYTDPATGEKLRRVTTILDQGCPKGGALIWWAGNLVADTALDYLPKLVREARTPAGRQDAREWLRRAHSRKKDERAELGTAVHHAIEALILDAPMPAPRDAEIAAILDQFLAFVADFDVTFTASEMVVANYTHKYAGTLDWIAEIPGHGALMGDTKTGGELDEKLSDGNPKGVYPEAAMQMAAYRHAESGWLRDGTKVAVPPTDGGAVLHLRPEGYRLYPMRVDEPVWRQFLLCQQMADWTSGMAKTVIGEPLRPHHHDLTEDGHCRTVGCPNNALGNPFTTDDKPRHLHAVKGA